MDKTFSDISLLLEALLAAVGGLFLLNSVLLFVVVFRYFTLFMNLLNDCSEVEDEGQAVGGRKRGMSRRLASLRHCTVLAMSNLLNANVDSGLMHSIGNSVAHWGQFSSLERNLAELLLLRFFFSPGLGYHKDLQTRATFMEVLTKILQQGTEFDTLAETVLADRFERLVELVTMMGDQGELPIAMALANVVPGSQWVSNACQFKIQTLC